MSHLFPLHYVYIGNILIGILVLITLQQLCFSSVNAKESPPIRSKLLTCCFCLATYILNWLLIYHYSFHDFHTIVTFVRLFTCCTFCLGAATTFAFVTTSMDGLYKSKKNPQTSPKWFIILWEINMSMLVLSLLSGSFCAYYFKNGTFFNLYYIFIDINVCVGSITVIIAMMEIRNRIKQIIKNTIKLTQYTENSMTTSHTMCYYKKQSRKLKRKKLKFDIIIIIILLCSITVGYNLYFSIKKLNFKSKTSLYTSPYPTLTDYISHLLFTLTFDSVLVLWIWKPCRCWKQKKNQTKTVLETPNINDAHKENMDDEDRKPTDTSDVGDNLIVLYICCPCLNCKKNGPFEDFQQKFINEMGNDQYVKQRMIIKVKQRRKNQSGYSQILTCKQEQATVTTMPRHSSTIELDGDINEIINLVVYNFENLLLLSPNLIGAININGSFSEICQPFGGINRVRLLGKHFSFVSKKGIKLCLFSDRMKCKDIKCIFQTINLLHKFDEIIGSDHVWVNNKNDKSSISLNEKLLKIILYNGISANNVLYIDSDVNAYNVQQCNICNVFGINTLHYLSNNDITNIQKTLL